MDKEQNIIQSWQVNAANWIDIIERNGIESRRLITNKAIVDAVCMFHPAAVLDIGCGEGWLAKALDDRDIAVTGVDIIPELVSKAAARSKGNFIVASYDDIAQRRINFNTLFDVIVINFALIGKESAEQLLASLPQYLSGHGVVIVQTLHPYARKAMNDYSSGWKQGSWDGLGDQFTQPYEWYFRTLEDWLELWKHCGFRNVRCNDILHPDTKQVVSVIFECSVER